MQATESTFAKWSMHEINNVKGDRGGDVFAEPASVPSPSINIVARPAPNHQLVLAATDAVVYVLFQFFSRW